MALRGFPANRNEFASHRHTTGNLDVNQSFEIAEFAGARDSKALQKLFKRILAAYIFDGSLCSHGGGAGEDEHGARRIQAFHECDDGVVFDQGLIGWAGKNFVGLTGLRMNIDDFHVAGAWTRGNLLEDKFLSTRNVQERQVFRRRTDKNQVVVLGIVQREEAATLYANALVKRGEDGVQLVDCQHFTYPCVVIQDLRFRIPCRVVIAHALVGPSGKRRIAENHPGLFGAGQKALPENMKRGRYGLNFGARFGGGIFPCDKQRNQPSNSSGEKDGQDDDGDHPLARRLQKESTVAPGFSRRTAMISNRRRGSLVKRQDVGPFWQLNPDGIGRPLGGIVLRQLRSKAPRLNANHGVQLGIKIGLAAKNFGRNLILFQGDTRMVQDVFRKITEQFAEGFRAMQSLAADESFHLPKILRTLGHKESCYIDVTLE